MCGAFDDTRQIQQLHLGAIQVHVARNARKRGELVRGGSRVCASEFRQKRRFADRREPDQRHSCIADLGDIESFATATPTTGFEQLPHPHTAPPLVAVIMVPHGCICAAVAGENAREPKRGVPLYEAVTGAPSIASSASWWPCSSAYVRFHPLHNTCRGEHDQHSCLGCPHNEHPHTDVFDALQHLDETMNETSSPGNLEPRPAVTALVRGAAAAERVRR